MKANDLPELERRLAELADALGGKTPTKGALKVWLDALSECSLDDVKWVLSEWPKRHAKPPLPAEVLKQCRERVSERIESEADRNAKDNHKPWSPTAIPANSEIAKRELAKIRAILAKPKTRGIGWAFQMMDGKRPNANEYAKSVAASVIGAKQVLGEKDGNP